MRVNQSLSKLTKIYALLHSELSKTFTFSKDLNKYSSKASKEPVNYPPNKLDNQLKNLAKMFNFSGGAGASTTG